MKSNMWTPDVAEAARKMLKKGWAKNFVEMNAGIPKSWYDEFLDEVTSTDDRYRKDLEHSLRVHGVRWV
jgi:hypothetical protein